MKRAICLPAFLLLLLSCLKAAHSQQAQPHGHRHELHHGHVRKLSFSEEDVGERVSRMLEESSPRPAQAPSEGLVPAPAAAPSPGTTLSLPRLGSGFNPAAENDTQCGAPRKKPSMALVINIFLDLLQEGLGPSMTFQGNLTALSKWRSILNNPPKLAKLWPDIQSLAKEYFNLTLPSDFTKVASKLPKYDVKTSRRRLLQTSGPSTLTVPVYFTVVTDPSKPPGGLGGDTVTLSSINQQMAYLNTAFKNTGLTFSLADAPVVVQSTEFFNAEAGSATDVKHKSQYHRGGSEAMNVYVRKPTMQGLEKDQSLGGIANPPEVLCVNGTQDPNVLLVDGIAILFTTMPDQGYGYLGGTLVHEVGHWLGLTHTFNDPRSCDPSTGGDSVSSTPVEFGPYNQHPNYVADTCDRQFDSCPSQPGFDPVNNWMDYSPDKCYETFTPEQITMMQANYLHLRKQTLCSYPGQVSPFLNSLNQVGSAARMRPLSGLLLTCFAMLAFVCLM